MMQLGVALAQGGEDLNLINAIILQKNNNIKYFDAQASFDLLDSSQTHCQLGLKLAKLGSKHLTKNQRMGGSNPTLSNISFIIIFYIAIESIM